MNVLLPGLGGLVAGLLLGMLLQTWRGSRGGGNGSLVPAADNLPPQLGNRYFRGINYLLNEQPDKALEVFLQLADVTPDTVDTHLALGNLFRRRGEMDNAIRCHQNIIQNPDLSEKTRQAATLELGEDYLRAGLLDRAEELFTSLADQKILTSVALQRLLEIFQQEKEWQHAIQVARQHEKISGQSNRRLIAHFYCQLAEENRAENNLQAAMKWLDQAEQSDRQCARISIMRAEMSAEQQHHEEVIRHYQQALRLDANSFPLLIDQLMEAYRQTGSEAQALEFLQHWLQQHSNTSAVIHLLALCEQLDRLDLLAEVLDDQMRQHPTVGKMHALLRLRASTGSSSSRDIPTEDISGLLQPLLEKLLQRRDGYQCRNCGLAGQTHHWHCPSCRQWDSTEPVSGSLGE